MASYDDTATVSGSVVGFNNGADSVPLKNWLVTLPASLDGYTEVNGVRSGKNLADGNMTQNGANRVILTDNIFLKSGTYTISIEVETARNFYYREHGQSAWANIGGYNKKVVTFTISADGNYDFSYYFSTGVTVDEISNLQIEVGSTATAYEAYEAPTQYTASLGRTIYGGQADIVNGQGIDNCTRIQIKGITWEVTTVGNFQVFTCNKINTKAANFNFVVEGYENAETYRNYLADKQCGTYNITNAMDRICIRDDAYLTAEAFVEAMGDNYIVYENTSPTDFTFTPITPTPETAKGSNTFWSDQGNTELTYYKDGYGFTSVTVHKETPEGEPIEETRKLHRIIYEGQVDVINGTGLIYRGESGTQYDPPEQISFTPIEIATDEGENTLYADQGDSSITYRKAVD